MASHHNSRIGRIYTDAKDKREKRGEEGKGGALGELATD